jgi:Kef-type K+ transport system membrane component KefB
MGGASSWVTTLVITLFLVAIWTAGRLSRLIGISSIVLEVATGLVLGPSVLGLIPKELSECYDELTTDCETRKDKLKIAEMGTEYCDLDAYLHNNKYAAGATWEAGPYDTGFWGTQANSAPFTVGLDGKTYCLNKGTCGRRMLLSSRSSVPEEEDVEKDENAPPRMLESMIFPSKDKDTKGKTEFDNYDDCLKSSCELKVAIACATTPNIFTLVGHAGVAMMIFESGMHFDFDQARVVGPWACAVAVLGTVLPTLAGTFVAKAYGFTWLEGLCAGTSLAPTSVGIALKLLHEAKALHLYFGQAVMTAAFVDDVLSLILFSVLFALGGDMGFMTFLPLVVGCVFMAISGIMCVTFWPKFIAWIMSVVPETKPDAKVTRHQEVLWVLMFATLCLYGQITHECGTHLWGCFIAGMSFATNHSAHHVWVRQVKRVTCWWIRIFFACTLAWSIPVDELFNLESLWKGSIMGIGPCVLTKVLCAPFMGSSRWVIGWAMVGRAEFAYFIAIMASSLKMIPDALFAIIIWALIYSTILAPLVFRKVLGRYMRKEMSRSGSFADSSKPTTAVNISGHLPDIVEEEELAKKKQDVADMKQLSTDVSVKNDEIAKLTAALAEAQSTINDLSEIMQNSPDKMKKYIISTENGIYAEETV